ASPSIIFGRIAHPVNKHNFFLEKSKADASQFIREIAPALRRQCGQQNYLKVARGESVGVELAPSLCQRCEQRGAPRQIGGPRQSSQRRGPLLPIPTASRRAGPAVSEGP